MPSKTEKFKKWIRRRRKDGQLCLVVEHPIPFRDRKRQYLAFLFATGGIEERFFEISEMSSENVKSDFENLKQMNFYKLFCGQIKNLKP